MSRDQNGKAKVTSARYATAWLDHGVNPTGADYEYTIMVEKPLLNLEVIYCNVIFLVYRFYDTLQSYHV